MSEIRTIPPKLTKVEWNALLDHGLEKPTSYIIRINGSTFEAVNAHTGKIDYSGTDASSVIQSAINAGAGKVFLKRGRYNLSSELTINEGVVLEGEVLGAPLVTDKRTVLVTYKDTDFITLKGGSELKNLDIAMGTALSDSHAILNITSSSGVDFQKPIIIDNVFVSGAIEANGSALKLSIDSDANVSGVLVRNFSWYGFNKGVELILNSSYPSASISGNRFFGLTGKSSKYFIYLDTQGIGTPYLSTNQFLGVILQCTSGSLRGIYIGAKANANQFIGTSIYDVPSSSYGVEICSGTEGTLLIGRVYKVLDNGTRTKIINPYDYITQNGGTATFNGDGTTTSFNISHGLVSTPSTYVVSPASADAKGEFYVTADSTYITVNYTSAPPSGTDNVKLTWYAEV